MLHSPASDPAGDAVTLLVCQRAAVVAVLDLLDQLATLVPVAGCLPEWQGLAKDTFSTFLNDVATELLTARAGLQGAVSDLDRAIAEESSV